MIVKFRINDKSPRTESSDLNMTRTANQSQAGVVQLTIRNEQPISKLISPPVLSSSDGDDYDEDGTDASVMKPPYLMGLNPAIEFALENLFEIRERDSKI